jgi:hypothetical protein
MASTLLVAPLYHFTGSLTPIGRGVLMIKNLLVIYFFSWYHTCSWKSVKQRTIARSSTEAKYKALAYGTAEVLWLRYLLTDL